MSTPEPDIFTNVHKGIRRALFAACAALGRAEGDGKREAGARALLAEALRFVAHHGENEDLLLLPLLRERAPRVFAQMSAEHHALDDLRAGLAREQATPALYLAACSFAARYLAHMDEEERVCEPEIRAVLTGDQLAEFGRQAVERTAPADKRTMLGWMLPAMTRSDAEGLLARLPPALAEELHPLASKM